MEKQITDLQKELNKNGVESGVIYNVQMKELVEGEIAWILTIADKNTDSIHTYLTTNICENFESNIKNLIYQIYDVDINRRRNITRNWHSYTSNWINSVESALESALENEDVDNIIDVNIRILEQNRKVKETQKEIDYFLNFVHALYDARDVLCPQIEQAI